MSPPAALLTSTSPVQLFKAVLKTLMSVLTAPLWFFDAVDKEAFVMSIPVSVRRRLLKIM
jgi:hypothetical protein